MTDNEIIKMLHCLRGEKISCDICGNLKFTYPLCKHKVAKDAIALIQRQQAEIDRLNDLFNKAEIIIRPEAIEEFKDRLKTRIDKIIFKYGHYCESEEIDKLVEDIDSIAKEMTEE